MLWCWQPAPRAIDVSTFQARTFRASSARGHSAAGRTALRDAHPPAIDGVQSAVVIGNGNVAIDVARVLAKSATELAGSDLSPEVTSWLETQPIETIHVVGRRSAADAKFTPHELAGLGALQRACPMVQDSTALAGNNGIVETLRSFAQNKSRNASRTIYFHF